MVSCWNWKNVQTVPLVIVSLSLTASMTRLEASDAGASIAETNQRFVVVSKTTRGSTESAPALRTEAKNVFRVASNAPAVPFFAYTLIRPLSTTRTCEVPAAASVSGGK